MSFSQQEEELLDALRELGPSTSVQLRRQLQWHTARLHPLLANLREKGVVGEQQDTVYPYDTRYVINRDAYSREARRA